jgi:hypothetical protein
MFDCAVEVRQLLSQSSNRGAQLHGGLT